MLIIPVLDLLDGVVVRGVAGKRETYRPVESEIATSSHPLDVACAFRDTFGLDTIYVADLDAILRCQPCLDIYQTLASEGFRLMVDCGLRSAEDADVALTAGASQVIAGLETWPLLSSLELLLRRVGPEQLVFSLDLHNGSVLKSFADVVSSDPIDIGSAVLEAGVRDMIVLDLATVGTGEGIPTLGICRELAEMAPRSRFITGGGVSSVDDLHTLGREGIHGALVASALHNGSITASDLTDAEW